MTELLFTTPEIDLAVLVEEMCKLVKVMERHEQQAQESHRSMVRLQHKVEALRDAGRPVPKATVDHLLAKFARLKVASDTAMNAHAATLELCSEIDLFVNEKLA